MPVLLVEGIDIKKDLGVPEGELVIHVHIRIDIIRIHEVTQQLAQSLDTRVLILRLWLIADGSHGIGTSHRDLGHVANTHTHAEGFAQVRADL